MTALDSILIPVRISATSFRRMMKPPTAAMLDREISGPFALFGAATLVVRKRRRLIEPSDMADPLPAYVVYCRCIVSVFGRDEAARIIASLSACDKDFRAYMPASEFARLTEAS